MGPESFGFTALIIFAVAAAQSWQMDRAEELLLGKMRPILQAEIYIFYPQQKIAGDKDTESLRAIDSNNIT